MSVDSPNVGVAFALVIGAGLATAVGASVVFFPKLVKLASRRVLAGALGLSAGVMTYVSFVEILGKSTDSFVEGGEEEGKAYLYSTLCFFGGAVVMLILDFIVHIISGQGHGHSHDHPDEHAPEPQLEQHLPAKNGSVKRLEVDDNEKADKDDDVEVWDDGVKVVEDTHGPHFLSSSPDPVGDLRLLQRQAQSIIAHQEKEGEYTVGQAVAAENNEDMEDGAPTKTAAEDETEKKKLVKMGVNTAIAIGLHNFPEGLATFVAALADPKVGAVLAIAIGIHNIPEGLCVALPIYYATGNRMKAFGWALLSGASEPVAALLGWAILATSFTPHVYALLFGLVAGMMVIISVRELLPTAHRYDPEDTVVTYSFIGGMLIMALSLVLFVL